MATINYLATLVIVLLNCFVICRTDNERSKRDLSMLRMGKRDADNWNSLVDDDDISFENEYYTKPVFSPRFGKEFEYLSRFSRVPPVPRIGKLLDRSTYDDEDLERQELYDRLRMLLKHQTRRRRDVGENGTKPVGSHSNSETEDDEDMAVRAAPLPRLGMVDRAAPLPRLGMMLYDRAAPLPRLGIYKRSPRPPLPRLGLQERAPLPRLGLYERAPLPRLGLYERAPLPRLGMYERAPLPRLGMYERAPLPRLGQRSNEYDDDSAFAPMPRLGLKSRDVDESSAPVAAETDKRSMSMLRMGKKASERSMSMLRMGRRSEDSASEDAEKRASMSMLRMGRSQADKETEAAEEKRGMSMLRMGKRDTDKAAAAAL